MVGFYFWATRFEMAEVFRSDAEVEELVLGMLGRTLPKERWTHAAHFAGAVWFLRMRPEADVAAEMGAAIRAYNVSVGGENTDTGGYHETITRASVRAAAAFLRGREGEPLFVVCNALMATELGKSDWLTAYWTRDRLWVGPDLGEMPF
jgi:hypothetical protein